MEAHVIQSRTSGGNHFESTSPLSHASSFFLNIPSVCKMIKPEKAQKPSDHCQTFGTVCGKPIISSFLS